MASMKDAALAYAGRGWPVFPCRTNKTPYVDSGVLEATTDRKRISRWWDEWPTANIGCDVGGAGMIVVDLDPGYDAGVLEESIGELPETGLVQSTPRGGRHLFYAKDRTELVPPSVGKIAPHVDVRSHHSYVLLAPSRTRDGEYSWECGTDSGLVPSAIPAYRSDELVAAAQRIVREKHEDRDTWIIDPDLPENISECVAYLRSNRAQVAVEGLNGDDMAYRTAAMCKSYGLSPETAFEVMWEHWNPRCRPPWSPDQAEHLQGKVANAYQYNTSPPGNLTHAYKVARHQEMFRPVSRDTEGGGRAAEAGRFRFVDERGIENIRPPEWLIEGVLPQQAYGMLVGPRSTFKTFVALDLALSVATGAGDWFEDPSDWLGPWPLVRTPGPVLFAAGEGRGGIKQRVEAWREYHIDGAYTENFYLVDPVPYPEEADVTAFIEGALALQPDAYELVVLDTLGRSMQGLNENSQQDASQFTRMVQTIQAELECAVLVLHHTGHGADTQGRARGSSVFGADVDVELVAERVGREHVRLYCTKQKDAPEWEAPRLIRIARHNGSLVAVRPDPDREEREKKEAPEKPGEAKPRQRGGGRKTREDMAIEVDIVRKAAYQVMKRYPGKEWSKSSLAQAIAASDDVEVAAGTIRNTYFDHLLTDKNHPVAQCFDAGRGVWCYRRK